MSGGLMRIAVVAGISVVVVAGCGGDGDTVSPTESSKPAAVDLSTLDTGKYSTVPRGLGQVASEEEGRMAEAIRMAEAVADLPSVDPTLVEQQVPQPLVSPSDAASAISFNKEAVVEPVLAKYGMICGQVAYAQNQEIDPSDVEEGPEHDWKYIAVLLARFPDEAAAGNAAVEMDAADFAVNPENVSVPVTKYPTAHGHWWPRHPSMASTLAHGEFVIHVVAQNPTPNLQALTGMVEKTFDAEMAVLGGFEPTPADQIGKLRKDPDGLLGRLVDLTPGTVPALSVNFASYGPNGAKTFQNDRQIKDRVYEKAGVDRLAIWVDAKQGAAQILRARDRDAAITLMDDRISTSKSLDHPIDGPRGLPAAKCFEAKQDEYKDAPAVRFICYVPYDRDLARVSSADEADVRQRAAAQYALLVNPL